VHLQWGWNLPVIGRLFDLFADLCVSRDLVQKRLTEEEQTLKEEFVEGKRKDLKA